jgi:ketosteroid isomerase-like protein
MSHEDTLRPLYEKWERGDFSTQADFWADDFAWGYSDEFPFPGEETEPDRGESLLRNWLSAWEHWTVVPEEFVVEGDVVVVLTRYVGRAKGSGVEVDQPGAHVWWMRGGEAVRLAIYADRARAFEEAGLAPR